jgi:hypothetical protein
LSSRIVKAEISVVCGERLFAPDRSGGARLYLRLPEDQAGAGAASGWKGADEVAVPAGWSELAIRWTLSIGVRLNKEGALRQLSAARNARAEPADGDERWSVPAKLALFYAEGARRMVGESWG